MNETITNSDDDEDNIVSVSSFDGQVVRGLDKNVLYEVGNFLGGGAAGTVYECEDVKTHEHYALKILNPLGYKLVNPSLLRRCNIMAKGHIVNEETEKSNMLTKEHVWWLINGTTKQFLAAYHSERHNCLKEMSLVQCIRVWGSSPAGVGEDDSGLGDLTVEIVQAVGQLQKIYVPSVPPKFCDFVRRRNRIFREIRNMRKISTHVNVIRLDGVLELTQESKCTIFLVMEIANGGELFDRIKIDCGTREHTAKFFFQQLLEGVKHCHAQGVCHRDLKPENLLLQDSTDNGTILKIADFGFSARFVMGVDDIDSSVASSNGSENGIAGNGWTSNIDIDNQRSYTPGQTRVNFSSHTPPISTHMEDKSPLRALKSVVGSPFYVAPEVLQAHVRGYDGPKADIWSLGVILYAMLAGNLPFEQDLSTCKRFRLFCKWVREQTANGVKFWDDAALVYPPWLFPAKFSTGAKGLIVAMLNPDPEKRVTVLEAMLHPLLGPSYSPATTVASAIQPPPQQNTAIISNSSTMVTTQSTLNNSIVRIVTDDSVNNSTAAIVTDDSMSIAPMVEDMQIDRDNENEINIRRDNSQQNLADSLGYNSDKIISHVREVSSEKMDIQTIEDCENSEDNNYDKNKVKLTNELSVNFSKDNRRDNYEVNEYGDRDFENGNEIDGDDDNDDDIDNNDHDDEEGNLFQMEEDVDFTDKATHSQTWPKESDKYRGSPMKRSNSNSSGISSSNNSSSSYNSNSVSGSSTPHSSSVSSSKQIPMAQHQNQYQQTAASSQDRYISASPSPGMNPFLYGTSPSATKLPPLVPPTMLNSSTTHISDLITGSDEIEDESEVRYTSSADALRTMRQRSNDGSTPSSDCLSPTSSNNGASHPPSFSDLVKRSTRFLTAVPASEVLDKVEQILEQYRFQKTQTPIGLIGKIELHWESFRLEVWGLEVMGPPLCALQLYEMPPQSLSSSPQRLATSFENPSAFGMGQQSLYLVEFIRGQLDVFTFKRFYQLLRQRISELVKRDYTFSSFDASSPFDSGGSFMSKFLS